MTLPNLITLKWDEQQIRLQIESSELAYKVACYNKEISKAMQLRINIDQMEQSIKDFQASHMKAFAERYHFDIHIHVGGQTREG